PPAAAGTAIFAFLYTARKAHLTRAAQRKLGAWRIANAAPALAQAQASASPRPADDRRELSREDLAHARFAFDRALPPGDRFNGFEFVDIFQTAGVRYQINRAGYVLSLINTQYTPNFRGYIARAQQNLIEKYLIRKVWDYWVYETIWGQGNFTNFDPVVR